MIQFILEHKGFVFHTRCQEYAKTHLNCALHYTIRTYKNSRKFGKLPDVVISVSNDGLKQYSTNSAL